MCIPSETPQSPTQPSHRNNDNIAPPECVPSDPISAAAYRLAHANLPGTILNHCLRVYLYAQNLAERNDPQWSEPSKLPILFTACMLHDIGCAARFDGPQRFEVEGADAAASLLRGLDVPDPVAHDVWQAIALHTSSGIAERIGPLPRLVRLAVLIDFGRDVDVVVVERVRERAEGLFPRLEIEKVLGDAVVEQALKQRGKAPAASWPGVLVRAKLEEPEWDGVNKAF